MVPTEDFVPNLRFLALKSAGLQLFLVNFSSKARVRDPTRVMRDAARQMPVPKGVKEKIMALLKEILEETNRWWQKHSELFMDRRRENRAEHLKLYFDYLVWNECTACIDDRRSAMRILDACSDWAQMQFQFACAYAFTHVLSSFNRYQISAFKRRLGDDGHPLYDFWLTKFGNPQLDIFDSEGLTPSQPVSLLFQWALENGYCQLVQYLWYNVSPAQQEYVGTLQWRKICLQAIHKDVFHLLCTEMCLLNPINMQRITWDIFHYTLQKALAESFNGSVRKMHINRLKFLLDYCCDGMRDALLRARHYRAIADVLQKNDGDIFTLLSKYLSAEHLDEAVRLYEAAPPQNENKKFLKRKEDVSGVDSRPTNFQAILRQWSIA